MKILNTSDVEFYNNLKTRLQKRSQQNLSQIDESVKKIILDIIKFGDKALFKYAKQFDNSILDANNLLLSDELRMSFKNLVDPIAIDAFKVAIKNIYAFHEKQKPNNYDIVNNGVKTSSVWKPIKSVGLYVPGGKAVYPSSLIMNVIPAKVAGVDRVVVVTPSKNDKINPYILAMLHELEINEIYKVGGAHSIAALAYGTETIKPVDKIFGPGNAYVSSAKKQVFGKVGIDLIAGPSEIVVVADKENKAKWVAADLIAQAEHDEKAQSILITNNQKFAKEVIKDIDQLIKSLPKKQCIKQSLRDHGIIIISENFDNINEIIDFIAPEHLHLHNKSRYDILPKIDNAGAIFLGEYSSEAFGDYIVGTNHILPTSGSSKFSSGLGVLDFMKRSSIIELDINGYSNNQDYVSRMATVEKLEGHKLSVKIRQTEKK